MADKNYDTYTLKQKLSVTRFLYLLPIFVTVGLLPLMVRLYIYEPGLSDFSWYYANAGSVVSDGFLYYRQWWFVGVTFYMLIALVFRFMTDRQSLRMLWCWIPLAVFAVFSLLSAICSDYPKFAFGGSFEQFENVFVLIGYAVIVYYSFIVIESEQELRYILYVLTASTLCLGLIGTGQTFGLNVFESEFVQDLIIPSNVLVEFSMSNSENSAFMTLYNPNYVGVYVAVLFPFYSILLLFTKNIRERILYGVTLILLLVSLYGSGSKAAFLVIALEVLVFIVFLRKIILENWYVIIPVATALVCIFLLINQWYNNSYTDDIWGALQVNKTAYKLKSIETLPDGIHFEYGDDELILNYDITENYELFVTTTDSEGNNLLTSFSYEEGRSYILDERFEGFEIYLAQYNEYLCIAVYIDKSEWYFIKDERDSNISSYACMTAKGKFDKIVTAEQAVFQGYERLFSGRGYIWSVSIPLLKDHIVLGSGADTFLTEFPQQDYYRLWRYGFSKAVMTKPHSLYLQVGVQDGVIAMIALIVFFLWYLVDCLRLYISTRFKTYSEQIGVASMLAVIGYAVTGISNDSSVTVSPIFWAVVGLGVCVNAHVRKQRKETEQQVENM